MERGHYNGYRGRSGVQNVLSVVVGALAVLVVLVLLLLLFGQRYIYYTADGVRLDLPFQTEQSVQPPDVSHVVVEILPPAPKEPEPAESVSGDASADAAAVPDGTDSGEGDLQTE
jgi:hypothetical protein